MSIRIKIVDDVAVIQVRGMLMGGEETTEVHEKVKSLIADGITKIILDLAKVKWMNSHGLGMLMGCYSSVTNARGKIGIARVSEKLESLMNITKINTLFDDFESAKQGIAHFR